MTDGDAEQSLELELLLAKWDDERQLSPDEFDRLHEMLRSSSEARKLFARHQWLMASLRTPSADRGDTVANESSRQNAAGAAGRVVDSSQDPTRVVRQTSGASGVSGRRLFYAFASVAATLLVLWGARLLYLENSRPSSDRVGGIELSTSTERNRAGVVDKPVRAEATAFGVAQLTKSVGVEWADEMKAVRVGESISPGVFAIDRGLTQLEFFGGATVVLEGPAELFVLSAEEAEVRMGRLRAQVPPAARGFSLYANGSKVVDLGTEFGLSVADGQSNLQVFDGEVELHADASKSSEAQGPRILYGGDAIAWDDQGTIEETTVTQQEFLGIADLESREQGQRNEREQQWRKWSDQLKKDSRVIAYYGFDQAGSWQRRLAESRAAGDSELDGAIVGANRVAGRWPGKSALEFKRPGDRVRVQIDGEYSSLSFVCWTKIDSLDRQFNSLFLTDNYNQGEPHWQILDSGQMYFSVRPGNDVAGPTDHKVLSRPFWNVSMSGQWLHLVTTYDAESRVARHFLNGEVLHADQIPEEKVVLRTKIGTASIGNWAIPTRADSEFAIRNLNGKIDEFILFDCALSADEVKEMYEYGKPN